MRHYLDNLSDVGFTKGHPRVDVSIQDDTHAGLGRPPPYPDSTILAIHSRSEHAIRNLPA